MRCSKECERERGSVGSFKGVNFEMGDRIGGRQERKSLKILNELFFKGN